MKKLAVIIDELSYGGAETQTLLLLNTVISHNYKVILFCLGSNTSLMDRISKDIKVIVLGKKHYLDLRVLKMIITELKTFKPSSMMFVNTYAMLYGCLASFFLSKRIKKIVVMHTTIIRSKKEEFQNFFYRRILNKLDFIVFVCTNQKNYWVQKYKVKPSLSKVIHNGIDLKKFLTFEMDVKEFRKKLGFSDSDVVIGMNACLRPEKRHEHLIDAFEILIREGYSVKLLFIGDGVQRKFLENYIHSKKLADKIAITGFVDDVRPYVACMDISALTSVSVETFSIAILESMAMSKPIVMSDIGGASELVLDGENGFLFRASDIEGLYQVIKYIIDNKLLGTMGINSRQKVVANYGLDTMVSKYMNIL